VGDRPAESLYRKEALEAHLGPTAEGQVLRLVPRWAPWTFTLLISASLFALLFAAVGTIDEYADGVAVVRVQGRRELTARAPGTVATIEAQPGQRVAAGQVIVRFHGDTSERDRLEKELERQLVKVLDDPTDQAARQQLMAVRAERDRARDDVDQRLVRAPEAGVVSDVRIQPGRLVQPGETVASLVPDGARFEVIAVVPGNFRPRLQPGMPLRVEIAGYAHAYAEVAIETIGDQVVGPTEIRRFLPADLAETLSISGPVVLVTASLSSRSFSAEGRSYDYYDGMLGRAEVRVGSRSVLFSLVPGLESMF
jgi:membrane fusion protein (multidrug efflux system)